MNPRTLATYWIDGKLVPEDEAVLPVTDLVVARGYGGFEALRTYHGRPFLLEQHLRRLESKCAHLHLKLPLDREELAGAVMKTLEVNSFPESLIRLYVTGGDASGFLPEGRERLMIMVNGAKTFPAWQYERGVAIKSTPLRRPIPLANTFCRPAPPSDL